MTNPFNTKPKLFKWRDENEFAITCDLSCGPIFGDNQGLNSDIYIGDRCNQENSCWIYNNGDNGFECDSLYKSSLLVYTNKPYVKNYFAVLDYEVFYIDYEDKSTISNLCKCPEAINEIIETGDISTQTLNEVKKEDELRMDLDYVHVNDNNILFKISNYFMKTPSEILPNSTICSHKYDYYLHEWLGKLDWKFVYRASEHDYTAKSFHEYCDCMIEPTLVIIKSTGGWIFGGYTGKTWKDKGIVLILCFYV